MANSVESRFGCFKKVSEVELYSNHVIRLVRVAYSAPDGTIFEREVVRHLGAVSVVPLLEDRARVILMSQFRASVGRLVFEVPAGKRDVSWESPQRTALRELGEELGLGCSTMVSLGEFENSPGFTDERSYSFLAMGLSQGDRAPQSLEESYATEVVVELSHVPRLISSGTITDAKTIIGLTRTIEYLSSPASDSGTLFPVIIDDSLGLSDGPCQDQQLVTDWVQSLDQLV